MHNSTARISDMNPWQYMPPNGQIVALIRHAEKQNTDNNMPDADRPLTCKGIKDAQATGREIADVFPMKIAAVWSSPVGRCVDTAKHIADSANADIKPEECPQLEGYPHLADSRKAKEAAIKNNDDSFKTIIDDIAQGCHEKHKFPESRQGAMQLCQIVMMRAKTGININVSHDWVIYLIAQYIGVTESSFEEERPRYLEPLFLWNDGRNQIKCFYHGRLKSQAIPSL